MAPLEIDPADFRGLHAVAHVGRPKASIWLTSTNGTFPAIFFDAGLTLPSHLKRLSSIRTPDPSNVTNSESEFNHANISRR